jgi:hypothetical protein
MQIAANRRERTKPGENANWLNRQYRENAKNAADLHGYLKDSHSLRHQSIFKDPFLSRDSGTSPKVIAG